MPYRGTMSKTGRASVRWLIALLPIVVIGGWLILRSPIERARDYYHVLGARAVEPRLVPLATFLTKTRLIGPGFYEFEPGVRVFLDPDDWIAKNILVEGEWESSEWNWIKSRISRGSVLVDVGAHVGTYTLRAAKAVGDEGLVIAIEPNPYIIGHLNDGVAISHRKNVKVFQVACGEKRDQMTLFIAPGFNTSMTSLSRENALHGDPSIPREVKVDVVPLDEIIASANPTRLDVLKVDTEGAETLVLRGSRNSINRYHPSIVVETVDAQLRALNSSVNELEALLRSYGYHRVSTADDNALWLPN
jgi:FkbM family methyltransferase